MLQIIEWFNGKKTTIAAVLLLVSAFLDQVVITQWGVQSDLLVKIMSTLDWFGMILGGIGLTHKGVKVLNASPDSQPPVS